MDRLAGPLGILGGDADIQRPAIAHNEVQSAHRLLQRRIRVGTVAVENVHLSIVVNFHDNPGRDGINILDVQGKAVDPELRPGYRSQVGEVFYDEDVVLQ